MDLFAADAPTRRELYYSSREKAALPGSLKDQFADTRPFAEEARLATLWDYEIMDSAPEAAFDEITELAARICGVPMAFITLLDERRQWFKSRIGVDIRETPQEYAFCRYAIDRSDLLVVPDARQDPRFTDNPLVKDKPYVRFYAGAPLVTSDGYTLGTLCILDTVPRTLTRTQGELLKTLSRQVMTQMDLRRSQGELKRASIALKHLTAERGRAEDRLTSYLNFSNTIMGSVAEGIYALDGEGHVTYINAAGQRMLGWTENQLLGRKIHDVVHYHHPDGSPFPWEDCPLLDVLRSGIVLNGHEDVLIRRDGTPFPVLCSSAPLVEEGRITGIVLAFSDNTERKQAQAALRESEERFRQMAENSEEVFWLTDPATSQILYISPAYETVWGRTCRSVYDQPMSFAEAVHPDDRDSLRDALQTKLLFGSFNMEYRIVRPDGALRWIWARAFPVRDEQGKVYRVAGIAQDITERKNAEVAMRASSQRVTDILESITDAFFAVDQDWRFTYVNDQAERLLQRPQEALLGRNVWQEFPEVVDTAFERMSHKAVEEQVTTAYEEFYAPLGLWLNVRSYPSSEGLSIYFHDITARKEAEEALRSSEQRLRLALESGRCGTFDLDLMTGRYLEISDNCLTQFALPSDSEPLTTDFFQMVHPEDLAEIQASVAKVSLAHEQDFHIDFRIVLPGGGVRWISVHGSLIYGTADLPLRMVGVTQDITDRKQQEAERERLLAAALERADRDPLTGLLNHRAFHSRLKEETARTQREGLPLAVLMLDLDNFKFFNDAYGHLVGDQVLRQLAATLQEVCPSYDFLARYGGDEFALLLPDTGPEEAQTVKARLEASVRHLGYRPPGYDTIIPLQLSVGMAVLPDDGQGHLDILAVADARLQKAKSGEMEGLADSLRASLSGSTDGFSMLDALVTAVDNKDRYTRCHSEDVLLYSLEIAQALGLDEKTQHIVAVAALLHDVGKIGVPDAILRKPGKLTNEEFAAIKQHPMMGAIIVGAVPGFEETLDAVRHHHERWDGGGYPFGLRGEETPLLARLMAVADAFSAMTTDRPYRKGMAEAKALSILEEGAGTQWDPRCIHTFIDQRRASGTGSP